MMMTNNNDVNFNSLVVIEYMGSKLFEVVPGNHFDDVYSLTSF